MVTSLPIDVVCLEYDWCCKGVRVETPVWVSVAKVSAEWNDRRVCAELGIIVHVDGHVNVIWLPLGRTCIRPYSLLHIWKGATWNDTLLTCACSYLPHTFVMTLFSLIDDVSGGVNACRSVLLLLVSPRLVFFFACDFLRERYVTIQLKQINMLTNVQFCL